MSSAKKKPQKRFLLVKRVSDNRLILLPTEPSWEHVVMEVVTAETWMDAADALSDKYRWYHKPGYGYVA